MSIGTLLAYTIVSASVIILRYKREQILQDEDDKSISNASIQSDNFNHSPAGMLKSEFRWLSRFVGRREGISASVLVFICCSIVFSVHLHFSGLYILNGDWWAILVLIILIVCCSGCLLLIAAHRQNPSANTFRVPWVPLVPGLSILCNVGLMVHLNALTWVRFIVWMTLGLLVYFLYGMKHSKESDGNNTYSMLITSSEASKEPWGTMNSRNDSSESNGVNEIAEAKPYRITEPKKSEEIQKFQEK